MANKKPSIHDFRSMKQRREKLVMVTAYDYPSATACAEACADIILVGDSLGTVVLGYDSTLPVTIGDMVHHAKAVRRGAAKSFIVADMPFLTYQTSVADALRNAGRLMQEALCDAVKVEGGSGIVPQIEAMVGAGIPVMGHIGLQPQSVHQQGGYRTHGKTVEQAQALLQDAKLLEVAGCFALVLECVAENVAERIAGALTIPVIGIGSGPKVDGQVLVFHDLLGINHRYIPKFAKPYKQLMGDMVAGVREYRDDVKSGAFPPQGQVASLDSALITRLGEVHHDENR